LEEGVGGRLVAGWVGECKKGGKERKEKVEEKSVVVEGKEADFLALCRLSSPIAKRIPRGVLPLFSKAWASLLAEAVNTKSAQAWWRFLAFPRLVLLTPGRGGKKLAKRGKSSLSSLIQQRVEAWPAGIAEQLHEATVRSHRGRQKEAAGKPDNAAEAAIVRALRLGDVKKALRLLCSPPLAPKGAATLSALKRLHPEGPKPALVPPTPAPFFTADTVGPALCSFGPGSAGGLFGYTPFHLQQCYSAGTWDFSRALAAACEPAGQR
jgi:hypothetical protein